MKQIKIGLVLLSAVVATAFLAPTVTFAAKEPDREENKDAKTKPFHGKVEAVDAAAKTLTVNGTLIYVSGDTKLTDKDKSIVLSDIKVGDIVHGTARDTSDGKTEAVTVKVGPMEKEKEAKPKD